MVHEGLSSKFRYAYQIKLPFVFPFYGLPLDIITPTTGGTLHGYLGYHGYHGYHGYNTIITI